MTKKTAAIVGLCLLVVLLVLTDLSVSKFAPPDSWAQSIPRGFRTVPVFAWVMGVLLGHLYHPFGEAPFRERLPSPLCWIVDPLGRWPIVRILVALVGTSALAELIAALAHSTAVWLFGLIGILVGAFLWPTSFKKEQAA